MKRTLGLSLALALLGAFGVIESARSQGKTQELANQKKIIARAKHNTDESANQDAHPGGGARPIRGNGITYHGGPVMLLTTNVYYIWYGNWSGNSATTILPDLAG